jgi:hypothetical protein
MDAGKEPLDIDEGTATNSVYQWQDLIAVGFFTG